MTDILFTKLPNKVTLQWLGFFAIAFFVLLVYSPSLKHVPRGDQLAYLSQTAGQGAFAELVFGNYDLNRQAGRVAAGDEILFRPVLYGMLGAEKYFFGYHFWAWQALGIALHLLVIFWFLKVCLEFNAGLPAVLMTAIFAVFPMNVDMVTWHHINAYLLGLLSMLVVLYQSIKLLQGCDGRSWRMGLIVAFLSLGIFAYELVGVFALLLFIVFSRMGPDMKKMNYLVLLPVVLYGFASLINYAYAHHLGLLQKQGSPASLVQMAQMTLWWVYSGMFIHLYSIALDQKTSIDGGQELIYRFSFLNIRTFIVLAGLPFLFPFFLRSKERLSRIEWSVIFLVGMLFVAYISLLGIGRGHTYGIQIYYQYPFWLLLFLLSFVLFTSRLKGTRGAVVMFLAVPFLILSGMETFEINYMRAIVSRPALKLIDNAEHLIRQHAGEPDFSFNIPASMASPLILEERDYLDLLYPQYHKHNGAKYTVL